MKILILILCLAVRFQNVFSKHQIFDDENFELLPRIYEIGRPESCIQKNDQFCHLTIKLLPKNSENPSKFWKIIEQTKTSTDFYNHDILKYFACVNISDSPQNVNQSVSSFYTKNYQHLGLVADLIKIDCDIYNQRLFQPKLYDWIILFLILAYVTLIIFATICDFRKGAQNRYSKIFSVKENLRKMVLHCKGTNMTCVQGVRFYTTIVVIFCHTYSALVIGYVDNTEYFEEIPKNWWKHTIRNCQTFIVQIFFVLSAWLLTYGTLKTIKPYQNKSPWKLVFLKFLDRYLRLIPVLAVLTFTLSTTWATGDLKGPTQKLFHDAEISRCRKNWWRNFIFINNFVLADQCCVHTWYIAADTQLYLVSLIILAIIWKFNLNIVKTFSKLIVGAILLHIYHVYEKDILGVNFKPNPENLIASLLHQTHLLEFFVLYSSPFANTSSYFIGVLFGYICFQIEEKKINLKISKISEFFWGLSALALILTSVMICNYQYGKITTSVLAALVKPMFALGVSLGILGMTSNLGGITAIARTFCEWKPIVFLGNMSYSVYLVQTVHVLNKVAFSTEVYRVSDWILVKDFAVNVVVVHFLGFLMHLLVELPMGELQNLVVPRMRAKLSKKIS